MRRFPATQRLDRIAEAGGLDGGLVDELAQVVAAMHRHAPRAGQTAPFGTPQAIAREVQGNLDYLDAWAGLADRHRFEALREQSLELLEALDPVFLRRRAGGAVRECHGDLHLENVARVDGRLLPFDGVEFEPAFRWVDVASDLAFLLMDLQARGHHGASHRLLDRWLQHTGDYGALRVLPHYLCYRALVRAKVSAIRADQVSGDADDARANANRLLALARRLVHPAPAPALLLTHGVSGSGKSRLAQALVERLGAVCLRSDVERARLFSDGPARYAPAASDSTYARLATLARLALSAGRTVIVDATFLEAARRAPFRALARERAAAFGILALDAPRGELERRVAARAARGDDVSQADATVLAAQCRGRVPLGEDERALALEVDTGRDVDLDAVAAWVEGLD
jgi:predicted kinase